MTSITKTYEINTVSTCLHSTPHARRGIVQQRKNSMGLSLEVSLHSVLEQRMNGITLTHTLTHRENDIPAIKKMINCTDSCLNFPTCYVFHISLHGGGWGSVDDERDYGSADNTTTTLTLCIDLYLRVPVCVFLVF